MPNVHHATLISLLALLGLLIYAIFFHRSVENAAVPGSQARGLQAQEAGDITMVALTAEQRIAYTNKTTGIICSEPSPDATLDTAESAAGAINVAAGKAAVAASVAASGAVASQASGNAIFRRSQSVQFLRDGMFHLCQGMLNGAIKKETYPGHFSDLVTKASLALQVEIAAAKEQKPAADSPPPKQPPKQSK